MIIEKRPRLGEIVLYEPPPLDPNAAIPEPVVVSEPTRAPWTATSWIAAGVMLSGLAALILVLRGNRR